MTATTGTARLIGLLLACSLAVGCSAGEDPAEPESATPTTSTGDRVAPWPEATPRSAGLDPRRLRQIARDARRRDSTCFSVVRGGTLVGDWNWGGTGAETPREVFSVTKSITSALVGIALRDGLLALDDRAARWIPAWRGTPSASVTIRNLLSGDSGRFWSAASDYGDLIAASDRTAYAVGLEQQYAPGTAWAYNNAAIQTLDAVLREATGGSTADFADERLFTPLGMADTEMTGTSGSTSMFFGVQTTCQDLARFGQLYLDRGRVDGQRILPATYVDASVGQPSTSLNAAYGHLWWLNRPGLIRGAVDPVDEAGQPLEERTGQLAPDAPEDLFSAEGLGGQTVLVDPESDTVVVRLGVLPAGEAEVYSTADAARVVTEALRPGR